MVRVDVVESGGMNVGHFGPFFRVRIVAGIERDVTFLSEAVWLDRQAAEKEATHVAGAIEHEIEVERS